MEEGCGVEQNKSQLAERKGKQHLSHKGTENRQKANRRQRCTEREIEVPTFETRDIAVLTEDEVDECSAAVMCADDKDKGLVCKWRRQRLA